MDAAGIRWTILSGFRDDYRQSLASGFKARVDNSLHGGSAATGGYRHGCAVDIADPDHHSEALWKWIDANSAQTGLQRLLPGVDPGHVQPRGAWHELAFALRNDRLANDTAPEDVAAPAEPTDVNAVPPSEVDSLCIFLRHRQDDGVQAGAPEHQGFKIAARTPAKPLIAKAGWRARGGIRLAVLLRASREQKSAHGVADARSVEAARPAAHGKTPARSLPRQAPEPRHALHAAPRNARTT
jgi:hypothetical protein